MMLKLLEFKEKIKNIYADYDLYLRPVLKFLLSLLALILINNNLGYLEITGRLPIMIILALVFAFIPWGLTVMCLGAIIVGNIFMLSREMAVMILLTVLIMMLLFFRFTPKQGAFLIIIPLSFFLKIPYVIPIAAGLIATPAAVVTVVFGTFIYYTIDVINKNASAIGGSGGESSTASINAIVNMIADNKEMLLIMISFSITVLIVYFIKRTSINNSWAVAIIVGGMIEFVLVLVGNIFMDIEMSLMWLVIGMILSILLSYILEFFVFSVDYSRTEHTQFEDDEYYYYVKAVPKINVTAPEMNVKRINAQRKRKKKVQ